MKLYPLLSALAGCLIAQFLKPFFSLFFRKKFDPALMFSSGKMPSSHSAAVAALTLAIGLSSGFDSYPFQIVLVFSIIVCYDAANVRYYAGQNISLTKKLIDDLKELNTISFDDPIYEKKIKDVLGHTYFEVLSGILVGCLVAYLIYLLL